MADNKEIEIINWEDIEEREVGVDSANPRSIASIDSSLSNSVLDKLMSNRLDDTKAHLLKRQFIKDLENSVNEGKTVYTYRALKTALIEMRLRAKELSSKVAMTVTEFRNHLIKAIDKLDNNQGVALQEFYTEAIELLKDTKGYEELEEAKKLYDKTMESRMLLGVVEEQKQLATSKVNLLDILKDSANGKN